VTWEEWVNQLRDSFTAGKVAVEPYAKRRALRSILGPTGAAPIPASSGQTIRYRLDGSGDRKLNRALHPILVTRKHTHQPRSPTSSDASGKVRPDAKQPAASSATSPATSTGYSNTERQPRLDKHRSITGEHGGAQQTGELILRSLCSLRLERHPFLAAA
jgi:hypothetical protein